METSVVRQRLMQAIERAKRIAADKRAQTDEATRAYEPFLRTIAIPLFRQIADALKASKYPFTVNTPSGAVRLVSDKSSEDYIELTLDTSGQTPMVLAHTSRARGRRVRESEQPIASGDISAITAEQLLEFMLKELEPFVDR